MIKFSELKKASKIAIIACAIILVAGITVGVAGAIVSSDKGAANTQSTSITLEEAKEIALAEVPGAKADDIHKAEADYDDDDGIMEYEVEIWFEGYEYDFTIDGNGNIVSRGQDRLDGDDMVDDDLDDMDDDAANNTSSNVTGNTGADSGDIGMDRAKEIALAKVPGATASDITKIKKDYEDGKAVYEGEIKYNGYEYDFEIDAATGRIIEWDIDD